MINTIKKISLLVIVLLLTVIKGYGQLDPTMPVEKTSSVEKTATLQSPTEETTGIKTEDGMLYGKEYDASVAVIDFSELMKDPSANDGKIIVVKGSVADVCQKAGCWMTMTDGGTTVRILTMHEFLLPKDIAGRNAVVAGTFKVTEISEEEAQHYNSESNNPKDAGDLKGPQKGFEIEATGIKILN